MLKENMLKVYVKEEEAPARFKEFVELDKPLTPQEAIDKLCEFHNASPEAVIDKFVGLQKYHENEEYSDDVITFKQLVANANQDFEMYCTKKDGSFKWHQPIDAFGNPMQITG